MAPKGPRDDFNNQRTQHAEFGMTENPPTNRLPTPEPPGDFQQPENVDPFDQETESTPWYRKPVLLIAWLAAVIILIGLIIFGISELLRGEPSTTRVPTTTTSTPSATATTTTTSTTTTAPSTTTTTTPSSSSPVAPPPQQPTQQPTQQQTQQPSHHHHLPQLPSVITIPGVPDPVTVPPGWR